MQEKLDAYAKRVEAEEAKREKLRGEARDADAYAQAEREVREWVQIVSREAAGFTREEKRHTLRPQGSQVTVWRSDYVHPDGWPQRYKIVLHFTGFAGQPVTLPPSRFVTQAS